MKVLSTPVDVQKAVAYLKEGRTHFFATVDIDEGSPTYNQVVAIGGVKKCMDYHLANMASTKLMRFEDLKELAKELAPPAPQPAPEPSMELPAGIPVNLDSNTSRALGELFLMLARTLMVDNKPQQHEEQQRQQQQQQRKKPH
jgi:hypothetical protein